MSRPYPLPHFTQASSHPSSPTAERRALSPQTVVLLLSAWITLTANWALWLRLPTLDGYDGSLTVLFARMLPLVFFATSVLLSLTAWPRWMKPVWLLLLLIAAGSQYFMVEYGTIMDRGMIHNIVQTDVRESADLFNPKLLLQLAVIVGLPALWLYKQPIRGSRTAGRTLMHTLVLALASAALLAGSVFISYRELAPVVRNNLWLRFMFNPVNPVLATVDAGLKPLLHKPRPFKTITGGVALGSSYAQAGNKPPLFVLVVGETARSANFSLNGYARQTNPDLAQRNVLSWRNATSCGTSTRESVPCMFSSLGREAFYAAKEDHDNLLDVLQAAGLAVLWVDNQAGCKGVCQRIPSASTTDRVSTADGKALCSSDGECLDGILLSGLDERIAQLDPERRAKGVVLVMHQMGSHGPAYYKRATAETKLFQPECDTNALSSCAQQTVINAYDNSIRYTDHFLAQTIDWLKARQSQYQTGLLYMSDHGESLGEMGIYLHGMPYAMAPDKQKHVPMIAWLGESHGLGARTQISDACLRKGLDQAVSHDNLYHTVLGLMDVQSPSYQKPLDAMAACRNAG